MANKTSNLNDRVQLFQNHIRWDNMPGATPMMQPETKPEVAKHFQDWLRKSEIVEYEILQTTMGPNKRSAEVIVQYQYYTLKDQTYIKRREKQTWVLPSSTGPWLLQSSLTL